MASPRLHVYFRLSGSTGPERILVFDTQQITVGRAKENDLRAEDPELSRRHAVFSRTGQRCSVQNLSNSNATTVNGQGVKSHVLNHGDVVKVAGIQLAYQESPESPAGLGLKIQYASELTGFGPAALGNAGGDATILGLTDEVGGDFEVGPASDFEYDLHQLDEPAVPQARDLDMELEDLDLEEVAPKAAPPEVEWTLEDAATEPESGTLTLSVELSGLTPELRRTLAALGGKVVSLPKLRIRIKDEDLG